MSKQELNSGCVEQRRLALIIGQNNYQTLGKLCLSEKDAKLMEKTLKQIGFQTVVRYNLSHDELDNEIMKFSKNLKKYDIVFFYYSGHANQQTLDDQITDNFLFGIDAKTEKREGWKEVTRGIPLMDRIIYRWFNEKCVYLMVLDACRKYATTKTHQFRFKDGTGSKLPPEFLGSPTMTLMAPGLPQHLLHREYDFVFACQPGKGAIEQADDSRSSGYLAAAFSEALSKPGSWSDALTEVTGLVHKASKGLQQPSVTKNLTQKIYLRPKIGMEQSTSSNFDALDRKSVDDVQRNSSNVQNAQNCGMSEKFSGDSSNFLWGIFGGSNNSPKSLGIKYARRGMSVKDAVDAAGILSAKDQEILKEAHENETRRLKCSANLYFRYF